MKKTMLMVVSVVVLVVFLIPATAMATDSKIEKIGEDRKTRIRYIAIKVVKDITDKDVQIYDDANAREYSIGDIYANLGLLNKQIADYQNQAWIDEQIAALQAKKVEFEDMKTLFDSK